MDMLSDTAQINYAALAKRVRRLESDGYATWISAPFNADEDPSEDLKRLFVATRTLVILRFSEESDAGSVLEQFNAAGHDHIPDHVDTILLAARDDTTAVPETFYRLATTDNRLSPLEVIIEDNVAAAMPHEEPQDTQEADEETGGEQWTTGEFTLRPAAEPITQQQPARRGIGVWVLPAVILLALVGLAFWWMQPQPEATGLHRANPISPNAAPPEGEAPPARSSQLRSSRADASQGETDTAASERDGGTEGANADRPTVPTPTQRTGTVATTSGRDLAEAVAGGSDAERVETAAAEDLDGAPVPDEPPVEDETPTEDRGDEAETGPEPANDPPTNDPATEDPANREEPSTSDDAPASGDETEPAVDGDSSAPNEDDAPVSEPEVSDLADAAGTGEPEAGDDNIPNAEGTDTSERDPNDRNEGAEITYVARSDANIRACPSMDCAVIGGMARGQNLSLPKGTNLTSWVKIPPASGIVASERDGFVFGPLLREPGDTPEGETATARSDRPGPVQDCDACPALVFVAAGAFEMGSAEGAANTQATETPRRRVNIRTPFLMARTETTRGQWQACVREGICPAKGGIPRGDALQMPVANVSWREAQAYADWLSRKTGKTYRLPSEAEWEYAARAGTADAFAFGETLGRRTANISGTSANAAASYPANGFGLHDMHGNVGEWVTDCWNRDHSRATGLSEPRLSGDCGQRVIRGGSWGAGAAEARSAARTKAPADSSRNTIGFRVVRQL